MNYLKTIHRNKKKTEEQKNEKENKVKTSRIKDDEDNFDIEDDDEDNEHNPNDNYYKYKDQNNCIKAYTRKTSNLITIDVDYAFLCCDLFIEYFKTSSLCTLTKHGFHFHYQYDNRFRSSRVFKHDYGLILKIIVVSMPPSYYIDTFKGELRSDQFRYLYFRFNNLTILPENIITYCIQISNNKYIPLKIYLT